MPPDDSRNPGARLVALREGLLAVHKALLAIARSDHEREHGPVAGPGALLQLLIHDEHFAWLHAVSELAARADELAEDEEVAADERAALARAAEELLTPDEGGAGFAKRYFDAIQASPDVAWAHAEARRAIDAVRSSAR
jgi:hypothetical protein